MPKGIYHRTDEQIERCRLLGSIKRFGKDNPFYGKKHSEETKNKLREIRKNQVISEEQKLKTSMTMKGIKKEPFTEKHKNNISKALKGKYIGESCMFFKHGLSKTKERQRLWMRKTHAMKKYPGELTIETIQTVYEDNIKKFGKLTCYLCEYPIAFGRDHLEHKIPASKGGTNLYKNLAVACDVCNNLKHNKTEQEYRDSLNEI